MLATNRTYFLANLVIDLIQSIKKQYPSCELEQLPFPPFYHCKIQIQRVKTRLSDKRHSWWPSFQVPPPLDEQASELAMANIDAVIFGKSFCCRLRACMFTNYTKDRRVQSQHSPSIEEKYTNICIYLWVCLARRFQDRLVYKHRKRHRMYPTPPHSSSASSSVEKRVIFFRLPFNTERCSKARTKSV